MFVGKVYTFCAMLVLVGAQQETKQPCNTVIMNQTNMCCADGIGHIPGGALDDIQSQFAALQAKFQTLESQGKSQSSKIRALETKVAAQATKIRALETRAAAQEGKVYFLAVRTSTSYNVNPQRIIHFPVVRYNQAPPGYGYNPNLSMFRCPADGVYFFGARLSVYVVGHHILHTYIIKKESSTLAGCQAHTFSDKGHKGCSIMTTAFCRKGESVRVVNTSAGRRVIRSDSGGSSHFTGFKL